MKRKSGRYWFPKSTIGKVAFWLGISSFALMYLQYWLAMLLSTSFMLPGFLVMIGILASGVCAVVALTKYKDRALLLGVPVLIGLFGVLFVLGELLFPH